jgi:hypothetical protein
MTMKYAFGIVRVSQGDVVREHVGITGLPQRERWTFFDLLNEAGQFGWDLA